MASQAILQVPLSSATITVMNISPTTAEARAPSKFHGAYHQQLRMQAQRRRLEAFRLYLDGKPVGEIADALGVDYSTAWRYIRHENRACRVTMAERVGAVIEQQSNVLGRIVNEAWLAWERSCRTGTRSLRVTEREGPNGKARETVRQIERSPGDPRFIDLILKALADIRTLFEIGAGESGRRQSQGLSSIGSAIGNQFHGAGRVIDSGNTTQTYDSNSEDQSQMVDSGRSSGSRPVVVKGPVKDVPVQDGQKPDPIDYTHNPNLGY
jgi:hypothetical protein